MDELSHPPVDFLGRHGVNRDGGVQRDALGDLAHRSGDGSPRRLHVVIGQRRDSRTGTGAGAGTCAGTGEHTHGITKGVNEVLRRLELVRLLHVVQRLQLLLHRRVCGGGDGNLVHRHAVATAGRGRGLHLRHHLERGGDDPVGGVTDLLLDGVLVQSHRHLDDDEGRVRLVTGPVGNHRVHDVTRRQFPSAVVAVLVVSHHEG